jgi:hypothetical protein
MARQQSSSELAGSLAATLTPSVPHVSAQRFRANQNSGLFDMSALYAETLDDVLRRARTSARLAPLARVASEPAWPLPTRVPRPAPWLDGSTIASVSGVEAEAVPIEFIDFSAAPRPRGLGWYGVAVAWLATVTTGAMIAISLPGHVVTHARALPPIVAATPPVMPPVTASAPVIAMAAAVVPAAVPVGSLPVAAAAPARPPAVAASTWPVAASTTSAVHTSALPASTVVSTKRTAPRLAPGKSAGITSVPPAVHARPAQAPLAATTSAPAIAAAPRATPPAKAAPASTAGMSLDELIRHEVQVESAKHK